MKFFKEVTAKGLLGRTHLFRNIQPTTSIVALIIVATNIITIIHTPERIKLNLFLVIFTFLFYSP